MDRLEEYFNRDTPAYLEGSDTGVFIDCAKNPYLFINTEMFDASEIIYEIRGQLSAKDLATLDAEARKHPFFLYEDYLLLFGSFYASDEISKITNAINNNQAHFGLVHAKALHNVLSFTEGLLYLTTNYNSLMGNRASNAEITTETIIAVGSQHVRALVSYAELQPFFYSHYLLNHANTVLDYLIDIAYRDNDLADTQELLFMKATIYEAMDEPMKAYDSVADIWEAFKFCSSSYSFKENIEQFYNTVKSYTKGRVYLAYKAALDNELLEEERIALKQAIDTEFLDPMLYRAMLYMLTLDPNLHKKYGITDTEIMQYKVLICGSLDIFVQARHHNYFVDSKIFSALAEMEKEYIVKYANCLKTGS